MIYRGILGGLEYVVDISAEGCGYPHPLDHSEAYFTASTLIPDLFPMRARQWSYSDGIEAVISEFEALGFEVEKRWTDGWNEPRVRMIHTETKAEHDRLLAEAREKYREPGYVRFGKCPKDGHSVNYADGTPEAGVSCFRALFAADRTYKLILDDKLQITYGSVCERQAYRLWGEEVGKGSDGEPVLKVTKKRKI